MSISNLPDFLTVAQTADELRCHPDTVTALVRRGELTAVRLGRAVRVVSASIQGLVDDGKRNTHIIRDISEETERAAKLAFVNGRPADYHRANVLRDRAAEEFANINGWRHLDEPFSPPELEREGAEFWPFGPGPEFFDHAIGFAKDGRKVALAGQPYAWSAKVDAFRAYAADLELVAHVPPNPNASFWLPPHTLFLVLALPGVVVQWLPEQEGSMA